MTIEVCCPSCEQGYLLEEDGLGSEFICAYCATKINLDVPQEVGRESFPSIDSPPVEDPAPANQPDQAPTVAKASPDELIVCPRCDLHFKLRTDQPGRVKPTVRFRVLIVEQEGYFQQVAEEALTDDYTVITATTVEEAETILATGNIKLLVLDLDLEGRGEGRRLLPGRAHKTCPILLFTAEDESEIYGDQWEELRRSGADDLVIKGINAAESLKRKVDSLLGRTVDEDKILR